MLNCYDLVLKYIQVLGDIDRAVEKKSKASTIEEDELLDKEITQLEIEMIGIKNKLKNTKIWKKKWL